MNERYANKIAKSKPLETIREHTDKLIEQAKNLNNLGYIKNKDLFNDLLAACEYHDIGKANCEFQKRVKYHKKFNDRQEIPHNVLSVFFVDEAECIDYISVCFAVLYHHYHLGSPKNIYQHNRILIKRFLIEMGFNDSKYNELQRCVNDINKLFVLKLSDNRKQYAILLKGFLHKCDYSASAGITCEYKNDFLIQCIQQYMDVKGYSYKKLQSFCLANTDKDLIVTAPTGMGKTEAGLLWCGNNKCFFILPLRTAINAMYQRIKELSGKDFKNRVALIHADMRSYYFNDRSKNESQEFDLDYCVRSKQMSLPITVCTPDQIFDFVLKYPGYEYKLATATYSKFIIDEIQMYDADLMAAIICAIKLIHNMGGKIAILTATLPPFVKQELLKIFGDDVIQEDFSKDGITRHNVKVSEKALSSEDVYNVVKATNSDDVKKYLVVCNAIDTADKIYEELKKLCPDIAINIFHSQFIKNDRAKKEEDILNASKDRTTTEIWISTSVVEASLDIDFDILLTELSDLFSLFQRFGRVNRKGKKDFSKTNCYVYTELQGNAKKYKFTDEAIYNCSKEAVLSVNGIITEEEKTQLINEYLSVEKIKDSEYDKDYNDSFGYIEDLLEYEKEPNEKLRTVDTEDVIPIDVYNDNRNAIEEAVKVLQDRESSYEEKLKSNEILKGFTLSVSRYKTRNVTKRLNIPVLEYCKYTGEMGLVMEYEKAEKDGKDIDPFI